MTIEASKDNRMNEKEIAINETTGEFKKTLIKKKSENETENLKTEIQEKTIIKGILDIINSSDTEKSQEKHDIIKSFLLLLKEYLIAGKISKTMDDYKIAINKDPNTMSSSDKALILAVALGETDPFDQDM